MLGSQINHRSQFFDEFPGSCPGQYLTLSYRWGASMITTTLATLEERKKGVPIDSMPQTYRDAITIARKFSIQYLWIDALCIGQDSLSDLQEKSSEIGSIEMRSS